MTFKFLKMVLTTFRYAMFIIFGVLSVSGTASATLIEAIANLNEGDNYRVVFVTSTGRTATSTDINVYNNFVSNVARNGSVTSTLALEWAALASTSTINAQVNTGISSLDNRAVTIFSTFGDIIATSGQDLWNGTLMNPIIYNEAAIRGRGTYVWTGINSIGAFMSDYELGSLYPMSGDSGEDHHVWSSTYRFHQLYPWSLYGISNEITKPIVNVPSPGTIILLSMGLAGLSFTRYRRQS
jgi:hypothetical protein